VKTPTPDRHHGRTDISDHARFVWKVYHGTVILNSNLQTQLTRLGCGLDHQNKEQSDSTDKMLELQGISWFMRKAIQMSSISLSVKHYKDDAGVERIDIDQTLSGGISGTSERRILDWTYREHEDHIFGALLGKSRRLKMKDITDPFLKNDWLPDTVEHGVIESFVESDTPKSNNVWTVNQVWGFELVEGDRKYARHLKFSSPQEDLELRLIYDYGGPL